MFKVNNKNTIILSLLLTLNKFQPCSSVSIVNFEHVKAEWAAKVVDILQGTECTLQSHFDLTLGKMSRL